MKGLLLKDWYMMKKYCRSYLLIAVVFIAVSLFGNDNLFFAFYPCLLCGMIPVTLLGYDERSRWIQYSATLPYTRAQIVSGKYLIGLLVQLAVLVSTGAAQGIKMVVQGTFFFNDFFVMMLVLLTVATITSSITMPFIFKLGVEKGRIAYYGMVCFVCAASVVASGLFNSELQTEVQADVPLLLIALVGIGAYALSWCLSIKFHEKREL